MYNRKPPSFSPSFHPSASLFSVLSIYAHKIVFAVLITLGFLNDFSIISLLLSFSLLVTHNFIHHRILHVKDCRCYKRDLSFESFPSPSPSPFLPPPSFFLHSSSLLHSIHTIFRCIVPINPSFLPSLSSSKLSSKRPSIDLHDGSMDIPSSSSPSFDIFE